MRIKTEFASNFRNIKTLMLDAYRQTLLIPDDLSDQYDKLWNRYLLLRKALATFSELPDEKRAIDFTNVELKKYTQNLPAYMVKPQILMEVFTYQNPFSLVVGHTGSGKSTQVP
jgi:HrpA-like RNA helicase